MKNSRTSAELSSIYLGIWPHYIGNPHTNERDLSAGIDRLSRADFGMPAEPRLATLSTACNCTPPPGWPKSIFATEWYYDGYRIRLSFNIDWQNESNSPL